MIACKCHVLNKSIVIIYKAILILSTVFKWKLYCYIYRWM